MVVSSWNHDTPAANKTSYVVRWVRNFQGKISNIIVLETQGMTAQYRA